MRQHYVPEVYLRQWCDQDGQLIRYCRAGPSDAPKLRSDRKSPKGICWEHNLYSLPDGGIANGITGNGVETLLSQKVEQSIPAMVGALSSRSGLLDQILSEKLKWLMQTFVVRSPSMIEEIESTAAEFVVEHEDMIRGLLGGALTPEMKAEVGQYLDPRMPAVAARAELARIAATQFSPWRGWYEGRVHVLSLASVEPMLKALGIDHFPTFDEPVVQWEDNAVGLVASFSVSPSILALVVRETNASGWEVALRHVISALRHRQFAICCRKASDGLWLAQAQNLIPWVPAKDLQP